MSITQQTKISVVSVSKKFCRTTKLAIKYGLRDITKRFLGLRESVQLREGEFWAFSDISFNLYDKECLGIIGANGAGKSTLLKVISGIILPDTGEVLVKGKICSLLEVGSGIEPQLTGRENIYIQGSILGLSKQEIKTRIQDIIDFSELSESIDMPVKNYSSGMRSRLGFAIATKIEPDILILDEVLAVGDLRFRMKCLNYISKLKQEATIIFVSHNLQIIERICDRAICLDEGKIKYEGDVGDAINYYRSILPQGSPEPEPLLTGAVQLFDLKAPKKCKQMEDFIINLEIKLKQQTRYKINIAVYRDDGIHCIGVMSEILETSSTGFSQVEMTLKSLQLMPGNYIVNAFLRDDLGVGQIAIIKNAFEFLVIGNETTRGVYLPEVEWCSPSDFNKSLQ